MKKYLHILFIICFPLILFSQDDISKSVFISQKIVVDGNSDEWKKPFDFYNSEARLMFSLANDSNTLYICILNTERPNQMRMLTRGMKVSIVTKGQKKYNASILYPISEDKTETNKIEPGSRADKIIMRNNFLKNKRNMKTTGFYSSNGILSIKNQTGLKVAIDWDTNNNLVYEIAIPFTELFGPAFIKKDLSNALTLVVEIPPLEMPDNHGERGNERQRMRKEEGMNNNDGMRNEEGMGSEGRTDRPMNSQGNWQGNSGNGRIHQHDDQNLQQSNDDRSYLFEKSKFKQKFYLSF